MTRAEQAEAQAVRNVAEAIERVLIAYAPHGVLVEATVWPAIASCGVSRAVFDRALWVLEVRRVVRRADGRVFYG